MRSSTLEQRVNFSASSTRSMRADVGIDKIRCAASIFDDGKICRILGSDDHVGGLAGLVDRVFHGLGDIG